MVKSTKWIVCVILVGLFLGACSPQDITEAGVVEEDSLEMIPDEENNQGADPMDVEVETPQAAQQVIVHKENAHVELPEMEELQVIDGENADELQEFAAISPDMPPYYQISADGSTGAVGGLQGIDIVSLPDGEGIDQIPVELPVSDFGFERFFQFNDDGSFIAVATRDEVQVWQVGGGLIYTDPYSRQYNTTDMIVGAEVPQLALSPDGVFLAMSAVDFSAPSAKQYFRVIDILKNTVVYEWDGSDGALHGYLYNYPGLGFSADGGVLQTFDPGKFAPLSGTAYEAFRFWSTGDWQELDPASNVVRRAFTKDSLLFALQNDETLEILDRTNGDKEYSLRNTGCSFDYPCGVKLSTDGRFAALVDYTQDTLNFRRDIVAQKFQIWDLEKGEITDSAPLNARNLDGVWLGEGGGYHAVQDDSAREVSTSIWWTSLTGFMGLSEVGGRIIFSPLKTGLYHDADCYYCRTCELDLDGVSVDCVEGFVSWEGNSYRYSLGETEESRDSGSDIGWIELPAEAGQGMTARVLGFSEKWQNAFYCVDQGQRQQNCSLYDLEDEIITGLGDVYALRFSAAGDHAAYIDREEKALFIVDLESGKAYQVGAYQSRAWPVNPAFGSDGMEMVYMIQNLNSGDVLSLEWVEAESRDVLRRSNLETGLVGEPSTLAWSPAGEVVAVGNTDGWIYLLDQQNGKLLHSWQAETNEVTGTLFVEDGKLLVTMNKDGSLSLWGVPK